METSVTCKSSSQRYTYRYIFFSVHYGILGFMDVKPVYFQSQMWIHQSLQVLRVVPGVGYKVFTHWGEIPDLWDLSCFLVDRYAGGGVLIRLCFSLFYLNQHGLFSLCWYKEADCLVFRSFSRKIVSYVAVDFLCLWEEESLKSFFVSISDCPVHSCVLDNFPLLWVQQCIKIWFYPEYTYFEMRKPFRAHSLKHTKIKLNSYTGIFMIKIYKFGKLVI